MRRVCQAPSSALPRRRREIDATVARPPGPDDTGGGRVGRRARSSSRGVDAVNPSPHGQSTWPGGHRAALCVSVDVDGRYGEANARTPDPFWIHQTAYDPTGVERLLGLLADTGVAGTFCWVGRVAEEGPDLVRRALAEGHEVAAHS